MHVCMYIYIYIYTHTPVHPHTTCMRTKGQHARRDRLVSDPRASPIAILITIITPVIIVVIVKGLVIVLKALSVNREPQCVYNPMPCYTTLYYKILYYSILYHPMIYYTTIYILYYIVLYYTSKRWRSTMSRNLF